jgi:hypothetical protein
MRYTMPSLALLLVVFGTACHCSKDASSTAGTPAPPANEATVAVVVPVPPVAPSTTVAVEEPVANQIEKSMGDSVYFSMQRTPCFGTCPSYTLTILEDGTAYYEGGRFAPREGSYTGKVSAETMEKLWELAETADFFSMQDKYDSNVTDLPSTIIRVHAKGKDKRVLARQGTPQTFKNFAELAEELLAPMEWTLVDGENK